MNETTDLTIDYLKNRGYEIVSATHHDEYIRRGQFYKQLKPYFKDFSRDQIKVVLLDEINLLRTEVGLPPRTVQQLKNAIKSKL